MIGLVLCAGLIGAATADLQVPPDAEAVVLGRSLFDAAMDPQRPLDDLLASLEQEDVQQALRSRALVFADLHLRGLKRHCLLRQGGATQQGQARHAYLPVDAFSAAEIARTEDLVPELQVAAANQWERTARAYHDQIRGLKERCPGLPAGVHGARDLVQRWLDLGGGSAVAARQATRRLVDDYVEALDIETAFPRLQYAANALSYRLGLRALHEPELISALRVFVERYQKFARTADDRVPLLEQALQATGRQAGAAIWILAFAFRNYPHLYDLYLLDPVQAARLEILFLRIKVDRQRLLADESKMLLHYPHGVYARGDRRASPYHFWSGTYVAFELLRRGHTPALAALLGGLAQGAYEVTSALRTALTRRELAKTLGQRLLFTFDRSATWEDTAGGMIGGCTAVELASRDRALPLSPDYVAWRAQSWWLLRRVKWLAPLYEKYHEP